MYAYTAIASACIGTASEKKSGVNEGGEGDGVERRVTMMWVHGTRCDDCERRRVKARDAQ